MNTERIRLGIRRYTSALIVCVKHLFINLLLHPKKTNRFAFGALALNDDLSYTSAVIPARELWHLFPGIENHDAVIGRMFPDEGSTVAFREMAALASIVRHERAQRVLEIGTSMGVTAYNLASNLPAGGELYTLDLPINDSQSTPIKTHFNVTVSDRKMIKADRQDRRFLSTPIESRVHQLYGDSATFDFTPYHATCDIVFVDGSHAFEYVRSDTQNALKIVKPGGLVLWHDYNDGFFWPDVHKYLNDLARQLEICRIRGTMIAVARIKQT